MSIVTLNEAKQALRITDFDSDEELQGYVDAVTSVVEDFKGITIEQKTFADEMLLSGASSFVLAHTPVLSVTAVATVDGVTSWDVSNLHVSAETGGVTVLAGPALSGLVRVTYDAGYATADVPARYKRGAIVILQHVWETQRGVGGARPGILGPEETYDPRYSFSIPRKALEWLGNPIPGVA